MFQELNDTENKIVCYLLDKNKPVSIEEVTKHIRGDTSGNNRIVISSTLSDINLKISHFKLPLIMEGVNHGCMGKFVKINSSLGGV